MGVSKHVNRRNLLKGGSALIALPAILKVSRASAQSAAFKIGYVSPQTGPLAGFAVKPTTSSSRKRRPHSLASRTMASRSTSK